MSVLQFKQYDSYILKHRINYNTSNDDEFINEPLKMCFVDYDLARKSQPSNAENFDVIVDDTDVSQIESITFNYYDDTYTILVDGEHRYSDLYTNTNVIDNVTGNTQSYYVDNIGYFNIGDIIEIEIFQFYNTSGATMWYHNGLTNEVWYASGLTENGTQWETTGYTTADGSTSGIAYWDVDEKIPILSYTAEIISIDGNYIQFKRILQKHLYHNYLNTPDLYYDLITLNHANSNNFNISQKMEKSKYGNYINVDVDNPAYNMVIYPTRNPTDIYFDYDVFKITISTSTIDNEYNFHTDNLYNRYNLEDFFSQLDISGYTQILMDDERYNIVYQYTGQTEIELEFSDINEVDIFYKYSYVNVITNVTGHTTLITDISGATVTLEVPNTMVTGETINYIYNVSRIDDISNILQKCYLNKDDGYFIKREKYILNRIYQAYADTININSINGTLRQSLTGIIYENIDNRMVLKIYNPSEATDDDPRLLYRPFEITRIGKDRKTNIPIQIYDYSFEFLFNVLDGSNIDTDTLIDGNDESDILIDGNI